MAYYWITEAQKYIQTLGFGSTLRPVNKESAASSGSTSGASTTRSPGTRRTDPARQGRRRRRRGRRGHPPRVRSRDPGLRAERSVRVGFEARSISEGFGDYWAVTRWSSVEARPGTAPDPACVADWDASPYDPTRAALPPRVDSNLHYPENIDRRASMPTGRIWSRALWDIRNAIGNVRGRHASSSKGSSTSARSDDADARREPPSPPRTASTARPSANTVRAQFQARGIL